MNQTARVQLDSLNRHTVLSMWSSLHMRLDNSGLLHRDVPTRASWLLRCPRRTHLFSLHMFLFNHPCQVDSLLNGFPFHTCTRSDCSGGSRRMGYNWPAQSARKTLDHAHKFAETTPLIIRERTTERNYPARMRKWYSDRFVRCCQHENRQISR